MQNDHNAFCHLGLLYYFGYGVKQDYNEARKYYELSVKQNNPKALNNLANLYFFGYGVPQNYQIAMKYYELSAKQNISIAINNLGLMYKKGLGVVIDYLKAKYYFKLAAKQNLASSFYQLGKLHFYGKGVKQNFDKARKNFEICINKDYHKAFYQLELMYKDGKGIEQNLIKAKEHFEFSAQKNNSKAFIQLGIINLYYIKNYKKAKEYFQYASKMNNLNAFFYLALIYENGKGIEQDISKAIECYKICCQEKKSLNVIPVLNSQTMHYSSFEEKSLLNSHYYPSNNNLGLIYITENRFCNIDLAEKYLKESGFNEYPFGQNNLGLYYQFYLNDIHNAKYFYKKSFKNNFSLGEFNLGKLYEKKGNIKKSIEHFINSSKSENKQLIFRNQIIYDERLDISKSFIFCYTNFIISSNYFDKNSIIDETQERDFFLNSIFRPLFCLLLNSKCKSYSFNFKTNKINDRKFIVNVNEFILLNPIYNLKDEIQTQSTNWLVHNENLKDKIKINLKIDQDKREKKNFYKEYKKYIDNDENLFNQYNDIIIVIFNFFNQQNQFDITIDKRNQYYIIQIKEIALKDN